jgi:PII-like signaling protein
MKPFALLDTATGGPAQTTGSRPAPDPLVWQAPESAALQLTAYCHAGQTVERRPQAPTQLDELGRRDLRAAVMFGGVAGFGRSRRIRTEVTAANWDDLPLVLTAVDDRARILDAAGALERLAPQTMIVLGDVYVATRSSASAMAIEQWPVELSIYCRLGRHRDDPRGVAAVIERLREGGVAGATVFAGSEGILGGAHRRSAGLKRSPDAPAIVSAIDTARAVAQVVPSLLDLESVELMSTNLLAVCKAGGERVAHGPPPIGELPRWSRLTLYTRGDVVDRRRPVHRALIERLRNSGARGTTVVRAQLGFSRTAMRDDRGWRGHRRAPLVMAIVDESHRIDEWLEILDELTGAHGLVTREPVAIADGTTT